MIATASAVAFVVFSCKGKLGEADSLNLKEVPVQTVDNMFIVQTKNGRIQMRSEAPLMERYERDTLTYEVFPEGFFVYGYTDDEKDRILSLVKYHMHHLYIIKNLPFAKTSELVKNVDLNDMILMFISDRLGRGQSNKEKKLSEISDIEKVTGILEKDYNLDLKEIKEKIEKIKKFI